MKTMFRAGAAEAEITPDRPLPNYNGQIMDRSAGTLPLRVKALVCRDDGAGCVILSIDATFIDRSLVEEIRGRVAGLLGVRPQNILVAATHSHATPATCESFLSGALPDPRYLGHIVERACRAVEAAGKALQPVRYVSGALPSPIGWCRRWVDSTGQAHFMPEKRMKPGLRPENDDPLQVRYVLFENEAEQAVAAVINVPCHNNFVFETYHADFFGWAGEHLRESLHSGLITIALPAPCGDIACRRPDEFGFPGDPIQLAEQAGRRLGALVLENVENSPTRTGACLLCRSAHHQIPDRPYDESDFCHDDCRGDSGEVRQRIRRRFDREEEAVRRRGQTACDIELQCIAFGDTAIVTNPVELFSAYDGRIRAGSPFAVTLVSELSNGYYGYVPTPQAFSHGCYETHRTVYTSRLSKDAGERIVKLSLDLLDETHAALRTGVQT
jgi:neutral ceramidase